MNREQSLLLRLVVTTFGIFGFTQSYYLLASFLELNGVAAQTAGLIVGAYFTTSTIFRPFSGAVTERLGLRRTLLAASALCGIGALVMLVASGSIPALFASRLITGGGFSLFLVALTTYQGYAVPLHIRGSFYAVVSIGSIAPLFFVAPVSEFLLETGRTVGYLLVPLLMALVCAAMSFSLQPLGTATRRKEEWGSYRELFAVPGYRLLLVSAFLFALADSSIMYLSKLAAVRGLSTSLFMICVAAGAILVRLGGRRLMDILPRALLAAPSSGLMGAAMAASPFVSSNTLFALCGVVFGAGMGYSFPVHLALIADIVPEHLQPKGTSILYFAFDISWIIVPVYMGLMEGLQGIGSAFLLLAAGIILGAVGMHVAWVRRQRAHPT
ncbi:MAG: MFS transporter [Synergistales bacterium]|nr:MFS transporter [Synergistales bacterium]